MKKLLLIFAFLPLILAAQDFQDRGIARTKPYFQDSLKVKGYVIDSSYVEFYGPAPDSNRILDALDAVDVVYFSIGYAAIEDINVPDGKTLVFNRDGNLMLTDSLTTSGTVTILNPDNHQIFDTDIVLTGTFLGDAKPEWFGADGRDTSDDRAALEKWIEMFGPSNKLSLLPNQEYYLASNMGYIEHDLYLDGNDSKITSTYQDGSSYIFRIRGETGDVYMLEQDVAIGHDFFVVSQSESTFHSTVDTGMVAYVRSHEEFASSKVSWKGQSVKITEVTDDTIYIEGAFYDNYLVTDTAAVILLTTPVQVHIKNLQIKGVSTNTHGHGITVRHADEPVIENISSMWNFYTAILIDDCYKPVVSNVDISMSANDGNGYGINIAGATTMPIVKDSRFKGIRHAVSYNGGDGINDTSNALGCPWYGYNYNLIAEQYRSSPCFDAHRNVGSTWWVNCHAIGSRNVGLVDSLYKGAWTSGVTYFQNNIVGYEQQDTGSAIFQCRVASTTGEPGQSDDWVYQGGSGSYTQTGFAPRANNMHFINCKATNMTYGMRANGLSNNNYNLVVENFTAENCQYALTVTGGTKLVNATFKDIFIKNDYYNAYSYAVVLDSCELDNVNFGNITAINARGLDVDRNQDRVVFGDIRADDVLLNLGSASYPNQVLEFRGIFGDMTVEGGSTSSIMTIYDCATLDFGNIYCDSVYQYVFYVLGDMDRLSINRLIMRAASTSFAAGIRVTGGHTIADMQINSIHFKDGGVAEDIIRNDCEHKPPFQCQQ